MKPATDTEVFKAMILWGTPFAGALGRAGLLADEVNIRRMKKAFPDYFITYATIADMAKLTNTHQETVK